MNQHLTEGFAVIGIVVTVLVTLGGLLFLVCGVYEDLIGNIRRAAQKEASASIARSLRNAAPWFCEDKPTESLLLYFATDFMEYDALFPEEAREEWRKNRADKAQS